MIPFRVFDREKKEMWLVVNHHPEAAGQGHYLLAREDDSEIDGEMMIIPANDLVKFRLIDFLDEEDSFAD